MATTLPTLPSVCNMDADDDDQGIRGMTDADPLEHTEQCDRWHQATRAFGLEGSSTTCGFTFGGNVAPRFA